VSPFHGTYVWSHGRSHSVADFPTHDGASISHSWPIARAYPVAYTSTFSSAHRSTNCLTDRRAISRAIGIANGFPNDWAYCVSYANAHIAANFTAVATTYDEPNYKPHDATYIHTDGLAHVLSYCIAHLFSVGYAHILSHVHSNMFSDALPQWQPVTDYVNANIYANVLSI
jgi:hypothetical protein